MKYEGNDQFIANVVLSLNHIVDNKADVKGTIEIASADDVKTMVTYTRKPSNNSYNPINHSILWNDKKGMVGRGSNEGFVRSAALLLFHEFGHRNEHKFANPDKNFDDVEYQKGLARPNKKEGYSFPNKKEQAATEDYENKAVEILNQVDGNESESERKNYNAPVNYRTTESPINTPPKEH